MEDTVKSSYKCEQRRGGRIYSIRSEMSDAEEIHYIISELEVAALNSNSYYLMCAHRKGMSLLQGPDLTNSLFGLPTRFRKESVAVIADIKAMYRQVKVAKQDRDFLCFLWWSDGDLTQPLTGYRMTVPLFGVILSTTCVSFALRQVADDNRADFPTNVTDTIKHNFYVDDCLKSQSSEGSHGIGERPDSRVSFGRISAVEMDEQQ